MEPNTPNPSNSPQEQPSDNMFMTQTPPPPTKDEKRRTALFVTIGLIVGLAALIAGVFLIFFAMANSAATNYRTAASADIVMLSDTVAEIDVDSILSLRDVTGDIESIEQQVRERPRLASVILGEATSASYRGADEVAGQVDAYYESVLSFVQSLPYLLDFAQLVEAQQNAVKVLREERPAENPSASRALAGSINSLADEIEQGDTPDALIETRNELTDAYRRLAEGYHDKAEAFEQPALSQAQAERRIDAAEREINNLSSIDFAERVIEQREQLLEAGVTLRERL